MQQNQDRAVSRVTQDAALESFKQHAVTWRRQSLLLACSAAVCLIAGTHAKRQVKAEDSAEKLKKVIRQTGINDSQTAKYIGVARALMAHVSSTRRFKKAGPLPHVLRARTAEAATEVLANFLAKSKVTTLEGMTVLFGRYRRKPAPRASARGRKGPDRAVLVGAAGKPTQVPATAANIEALLSPTMLKRVKTENIVMAAERAGHSPVALATAAIATVKARSELLELERCISTRMNQLGKTGHARRAAPPLRKSA